MVDVYHLFKLGTAAARVLKASNGARNAAVIFKSLWKPLVAMGAYGAVDQACEEVVDKVVNKMIEESNNGCSR